MPGMAKALGRAGLEVPVGDVRLPWLVTFLAASLAAAVAATADVVKKFAYFEIAAAADWAVELEGLIEDELEI